MQIRDLKTAVRLLDVDNGGKVMFKRGDVKLYESEACHGLVYDRDEGDFDVFDIPPVSFLHDKRIKKATLQHAYVYPLGKCDQGYWFYVCPECGLIHARHKTSKLKDIPAGCQGNKRQRFVLLPDGMLPDGRRVAKMPHYRITLVTK